MDIPPGGSGIGRCSSNARVDAGFIPGAIRVRHIQGGIDTGEAVSRSVGLGH